MSTVATIESVVAPAPGTAAPPHAGPVAPPHDRTLAPPHAGPVASPHDRTLAPPHDGTVAPPHHRTLAPRKALTTRFLDFWLLGGASLLVWLVMISVEGFRARLMEDHVVSFFETPHQLALLVSIAVRKWEIHEDIRSSTSPVRASRS